MVGGMMAEGEWCRGRRPFQGLLVTDLDGTLLSDDGRIADADLAALAGLRAMGYCTAIATGRSGYSFWRLMADLGFSRGRSTLPIDYLILSTGAAIFDHGDGRLLRCTLLAADDVAVIGRYLEQTDLDYMIHRPVPANHCFSYRWRGGVNPDFHRRLHLAGDLASPLHPDQLERFGPATELICIVPEPGGHAVAARLQADLHPYSVIKATSPLDHRSMWIEIFSRQVSKSRSVQWLADHLGVSRHQVAAVGNDYNDEDLLHWAGRAFVVANSPPGLSASFVMVASNSQAGVSEAIARWKDEPGINSA